MGYYSAATIVNRFGAAEKSIANTFALMGPHYILDDDYMGKNLQLVVFARTQFLKETKCKGRFTPTFDEDADEWYQCKKDHQYSLAFETMSQEEYEALFDDTANADFLQEAAFLLQRVQKQVEAWI